MSDVKPTAPVVAPAKAVRVPRKSAEDIKKSQYASHAIQLPVFPYQSLGHATFSNVKKNMKLTIPLSAAVAEIQRKGALEERVIRRLLHQQVSSVVTGVKRVDRSADDYSSDDDEATGATTSALFNLDSHTASSVEGMIVGISSMKPHMGGHSQSGAAINRKVTDSSLVDFKVDVVVTTADVVFGICPGTCMTRQGPYPLTIEVDVLTTDDERLTILVSSTEGETAGVNAPMLVTAEHSCIRAQAFFVPRVTKGDFRLEVSDVSYKTVLRFKADLTGDEAARIAADKKKKGHY